MFTVGMDILVNSLYETLTLFFYLFLTYLLMEYLEHKTSQRTLAYLKKSGKYGPIIGGFLGLMPQCGFSVAAANLYATRIITLGTLMAVFLSTSDEMLPILISGGISTSIIVLVLFLKVVFAVFTGVIIDNVLPQKYVKHHLEPDISTFCQREHCKCETSQDNIWKSAFKHTEKISIFIFICSLILNTAFTFGGAESIRNALTGMPVLSKLIAAGAGLIPSCYPSVLLSQLYLDKAISLGTMMAGTLSNAGLGFLVLYKVNPNEKENLRILALLYGCGVVFGLATEFFS